MLYNTLWKLLFICKRKKRLQSLSATRSNYIKKISAETNAENILNQT